MTDSEMISLIKRYTCFCDSYLHNDYIKQLNSFRFHFTTNPIDILNLYRAKIRYEAFKEFSSDIYKILYKM